MRLDGGNIMSGAVQIIDGTLWFNRNGRPGRWLYVNFRPSGGLVRIGHSRWFVTIAWFSYSVVKFPTAGTE